MSHYIAGDISTRKISGLATQNLHSLRLLLIYVIFKFYAYLARFWFHITVNSVP